MRWWCAPSPPESRPSSSTRRSRLADAELPNWSPSPDFHYAVGDLYLEWASRNPDRALKDFLPISEWAWKRCLEIGERDDLEGSVQGRGGYMPAHNLSVMFGALGLDDLAVSLRGQGGTVKPVGRRRLDGQDQWVWISRQPSGSWR